MLLCLYTVLDSVIQEVSVMKILGIVAEYDPFHNGHLFHMAESIRLVQPDLTFVVLSPCLKQRGELSLLSPSDRALCALNAGADAVFALPVCWTVRDAEHYALGALSLLSSLGVTHLAFGAETPDISLLMHAAELLESPVPSFTAALKEALTAGAGYPAAVSKALSFSLPEASGLLDRPNNILSVSYLRAVIRLSLSLKPVVIPRSGSYHAVDINLRFPSASAVREALMYGNYAAAFNAVPSFTADLLRRRFLEKRVPDEDIFSALLLTRLRTMNNEDYLSLPDVSEGLENALKKAVPVVQNYHELIVSLSGKRYPSSRISRLCASAVLGITRKTLDSLSFPDCALLLGLRRRSDMTGYWKTLPVPVISSFAEWKKAAHPADLAAWRLWAQCCHLPDTLPFTEKTIAL